MKPEIIDDDADKVGYSVTETIAQGKDWDMTLTPEEGTHKYQVKLKANASSGEIKSPKGVKLHRISIKGNHNHDIPDTAGAYIDVPYVSGWAPDEYDDLISKARNPFNGNDCSGLAFCAGYDAGMTIDEVYTAVLEAHYYDPNLTKADRQPGDLWSVLDWSHVGIYYTDYIIHASSTNDKVVEVYIGTDPEGWWFKKFSGLGRK